MRKLHPVGITPSRDGLVLSARKGSKTGSYVVPIGDELLEKLAEAQRLRNGSYAPPAGDAEPDRRAPAGGEAARAPRAESSLTPREIQARLRAGRSIAEVAKEAKVGAEWVERFAPPVLAEQAQIVLLARGLTFAKARLGPSSQPLGESVAWSLVDRGVVLTSDEFDAAWDAYQVRDAVWVVRFGYRSRGRPQEAAWELDVGAGTVTALDRLASELGYVDPTRRRRPTRTVSADDGEGEAEAEAEAPEGGAGPARAPARRSAATRRAGGARPGAATKATKRATKGTKKATKGTKKATKAKKATTATKKKATKAKKATTATKKATRATGRPTAGRRGSGTTRSTRAAGPGQAAPSGSRRSARPGAGSGGSVSATSEAGPEAPAPARVRIGREAPPSPAPQTRVTGPISVGESPRATLARRVAAGTPRPEAARGNPGGSPSAGARAGTARPALFNPLTPVASPSPAPAPVRSSPPDPDDGLSPASLLVSAAPDGRSDHDRSATAGNGRRRAASANGRGGRTEDPFPRRRSAPPPPGDDEQEGRVIRLPAPSPSARDTGDRPEPRAGRRPVRRTVARRPAADRHPPDAGDAPDRRPADRQPADRRPADRQPRDRQPRDRQPAERPRRATPAAPEDQAPPSRPVRRLRRPGGRPAAAPDPARSADGGDGGTPAPRRDARRKPPEAPDTASLASPPPRREPPAPPPPDEPRPPSGVASSQADPVVGERPLIAARLATEVVDGAGGPAPAEPGRPPFAPPPPGASPPRPF